jgi:hypothetical protein
MVWMRQSALKRNAKYGVALLLTGVVLLLLFLKPGPASAVSLTLVCPDATPGSSLTCTATLAIENVENIPIESLQFDVSGAATFAATTFDARGNVISKDTKVTSVTLVSAQSTPINAGVGYAYGYGYGYGNRSGTDRTKTPSPGYAFGYGYGYGYGFGYGLAQQTLTLVYSIVLAPTVAGSYTAAFKVNTDDPNKPFGPVQDLFTVSNSPTATISTTITTTPVQRNDAAQKLGGLQPVDQTIQVGAGFTLTLPFTGATVGQIITPTLGSTITLGNLTITPNQAGISSVVIDLGGGLRVTGGAVLRGIAGGGVGLTISDPRLGYVPLVPSVLTLAGGNADVTAIGASFSIGLVNLPNGASLASTFVKDVNLAVAQATTKFALVAGSTGGAIGDLADNVGFAMTVTKLGITNADLGDTELSMQVSKTWFTKRRAEGKGIFISKFDDAGNQLLPPVDVTSRCVADNGTVTCTGTFTGAQKGLSAFALAAITPAPPRLGGGGGGVPISAIPPPVVLSEVRSVVSPIAETRIETPDGQVSVTVPANALPPAVLGRTVEVEVRSLDPATVPAPPASTVFVRGIELNTLINSQRLPLTFIRSVTMRVPMTATDLARAGGDPSKLSVYRYDPGTGFWSSLTTAFQATPTPGVLETQLDTFSLFALGILHPVPVVPPPTAVVPPAPILVGKGPKGDAGAKGAVGNVGPAGPAGDRGPAGPAGVKGERGSAGAVGSAGAAGAKGASGASGIAGASGGVSALDIIGLILALVAVAAVGAALVMRRRTS